jgi:3-oxoacyl-ACP reductase-like protein
MHKHSSTPKDENQIAISILDQITQSTRQNPTKNPAVVSLGRLGGLKGGKARAKKLSSKRRKEIAVKAAETRWKKNS